MKPAQQGTLNGMFEAIFKKKLEPGENVTMEQLSLLFTFVVRDLEPELPPEEHLDVLKAHCSQKHPGLSR